MSGCWPLETEINVRFNLEIFFSNATYPNVLDTMIDTEFESDMVLKMYSVFVLDI